MIPPFVALRFLWRAHLLISLSHVSVRKVPPSFTPRPWYTNQRLRAGLRKAFGVGDPGPRTIDHAYRDQEHSRQSSRATRHAEQIGLRGQQYEGLHYGWRLRRTTEALLDPSPVPPCIVSLPKMRALTAWRGVISPESRACRVRIAHPRRTTAPVFSDIKARHTGNRANRSGSRALSQVLRSIIKEH